ncbi:MAG: hypothetical protein JWL96_3527 [Sphingomonas bacterium]|uniref:hypothetical protein n=1 Tax=Sphingomonas bacterium TaxID=1895847 RepID=UPI00260ECAAC|nr:hypothetical protein [Sphingomonas bacterium]MDB5711457.1 hypothetical protein [Sphingomonas bacterium]
MPNSRTLLVGGLFVAIFAMVALLVDTAFTRSIVHSQSLEPGRLARVVYGEDRDDYPIFGSSQGCANYIPTVLGDHYYNYCVKGASHSVVNMMLKYEIQNGSKSPIVVDMRQGTIAFIGDVRDLIPFARSPDMRSTIERNGVWRWYYDIPGLRYFGSYDWYLKGLLTEAAKRHGMSQLAGSRGGDRGYTNDFAAPWSASEFRQIAMRRLRFTEKFGLKQQDQAELIALIKSAPQRKFVLVLSPLNWSFLAHVANEAGLNRQIAQWRALPNVTVVDWTRKRYPDEYFFDTGHLNRRGAGVFSQELRPVLDRAFATKASPQPSAPTS